MTLDDAPIKNQGFLFTGFANRRANPMPDYTLACTLVGIFQGKFKEMSDRTNATIRRILANWTRIISRAVARQNTISDGLRAWLEWSSIRTKPRRDRAARNWDFFRAFGIPTVRHFLSYEKKGHYGWSGPASRNPLRSGNRINYYSPSNGHMLGMMNRPRWERFFWFLSLGHPYLRWGSRLYGELECYC